MLAAVWFGLVMIGSVFGAEPTRCCVDKQYSVVLGDVGEVLLDNPEYSFFIDGYMRLGYDYYRDRQAVVAWMKQPDGSMQQKYELKDYATRRLYTSVDNGTCTYTHLPPYDVMRQQCIPDNATYMGPAVFGYGARSLKVHTWLFMLPITSEKPDQVYLSVTQDHCVPVTESVIGIAGGYRVEQSLFFINYHPGIENLNSLEIPSGCTLAASTPASG